MGGWRGRKRRRVVLPSRFAGRWRNCLRIGEAKRASKRVAGRPWRLLAPSRWADPRLKLLADSPSRRYRLLGHTNTTRQ